MSLFHIFPFYGTKEYMIWYSILKNKSDPEGMVIILKFVWSALVIFDSISMMNYLFQIYVTNEDKI